MMSGFLGPALPEPLRTIRDEAASCVRCPLAMGAKSTVVYRGDSNPIVLFIGEAPGAEEDIQGEPFVGRSGDMLDEKLAETSFPRWGITNTILHRPPNNRYDSAYGEACRPYLERVIKALTPKVIVTLGKKAAIAVNNVGVDIPTFALVHPAAQFYDGSKKAEWDSGWVKLRMWLGSKGVVSN